MMMPSVASEFRENLLHETDSSVFVDATNEGEVPNILSRCSGTDLGWLCRESIGPGFRVG
jgi:hypothetical protein